MEGKAPALKVTAPCWRLDIHGAADLVEEVVRLDGAIRMPSTPLPRAEGVAKPVLTSLQKRADAGAAHARGARAGGGRHLVVHPA